jgi:hypothetical protein
MPDGGACREAQAGQPSSSPWDPDRLRQNGALPWSGRPAPAAERQGEQAILPNEDGWRVRIASRIEEIGERKMSALSEKLQPTRRQYLL